MASQRRPAPDVGGVSTGPDRAVWNTRNWMARWLAASLRAAPITLLHGGTAAARSAALRDGVWPLLARRTEDCAWPLQGARIFDFPQRADAGARHIPRRRAERVLLIDPAQEDAARSLSRLIDGDENAPPTANRRVLVLLDGFERMAMPSATPHTLGRNGAEALWRELDRHMRARPLVLHLLIATQDADDAALRKHAGSWPGFGEQVIDCAETGDAAPHQLHAAHRCATAPHSSGVDESMAGGRELDAPPAGMAPVRDASGRAAVEAAWQDSLQSVLDDVARLSRLEASRVEVPSVPVDASRSTFGGSTAPADFARTRAGGHSKPRVDPAVAIRDVASADTAGVTGPDTVDIALDFASVHMEVIETPLARVDAPANHAPDVGSPPAIGAPGKMSFHRRRHRAGSPRLLVACLCGALALLSFGAFIFWRMSLQGQDSRRGIDPAVPPPQAVEAGERAAGRTVDHEPGRALRQALAGLPLRDLRADADPVAALATASMADPDAAAVLALLRYDALDTGAGPPSGPGSPTLRLVAPLFIEPLQAFVRADSPLHSLADLRGRRIDVGRDDAVTAQRMLSLLSGARVPEASISHLDDTLAIERLERGEIDAVLRLGPTAMTAPSATPLRHLRLDRDDPRTAPALRRYLATSTEAGTDTLGVMSFLAVAGRNINAVEKLAGNALTTLCNALPVLRAGAHPAWQAVRPDVQLPAGMPYAAAAKAAGPGCGATGGPALRAKDRHTPPEGDLK